MNHVEINGAVWTLKSTYGAMILIQSNEEIDWVEDQKHHNMHTPCHKFIHNDGSEIEFEGWLQLGNLHKLYGHPKCPRSNSICIGTHHRCPHLGNLQFCESHARNNRGHCKKHKCKCAMNDDDRRESTLLTTHNGHNDGHYGHGHHNDHYGHHYDHHYGGCKMSEGKLCNTKEGKCGGYRGHVCVGKSDEDVMYINNKQSPPMVIVQKPHTVVVRNRSRPPVVVQQPPPNVIVKNDPPQPVYVQTFPPNVTIRNNGMRGDQAANPYKTHCTHCTSG